MPKPSSLKRKRWVGVHHLYFRDSTSDSHHSNDSAVATTKKAKKNSLKGTQNGSSSLDYDDQAALNRRAQRFQREHEIEKMKTAPSGYSGYGGYKAISNTANTYGNKNAWGNAGFDEVDADPVNTFMLSWISVLTRKIQNVIDWDRYTIVGTNQEIFKDYLRLTTVGVLCHDFGPPA